MYKVMKKKVITYIQFLTNGGTYILKKFQRGRKHDMFSIQGNISQVKKPTLPLMCIKDYVPDT